MPSRSRLSALGSVRTSSFPCTSQRFTVPLPSSVTLYRRPLNVPLNSRLLSVRPMASAGGAIRVRATPLSASCTTSGAAGAGAIGAGAGAAAAAAGAATACGPRDGSAACRRSAVSAILPAAERANAVNCEPIGVDVTVVMIGTSHLRGGHRLCLMRYREHFGHQLLFRSGKRCIRAVTSGVAQCRLFQPFDEMNMLLGDERSERRLDLALQDDEHRHDLVGLLPLGLRHGSLFHEQADARCP